MCDASEAKPNDALIIYSTVLVVRGPSSALGLVGTGPRRGRADGATSLLNYSIKRSDILHFSVLNRRETHECARGETALVTKDTFRLYRMSDRFVVSSDGGRPPFLAEGHLSQKKGEEEQRSKPVKQTSSIRCSTTLVFL